MWCNVAHHLALKNQNKEGRKKIEPKGTSSVRASISFPRNIYQTLDAIARQKKVSLAWIVREATEQYISDRWPLFKDLT